MKLKLAFALLAVLSLGLIRSTGAAAQFETPSRAFHNATEFRLEGKHVAVRCEACHVNAQYKGTPKTCFECHWIRRKDDRFQTRLGTQCEQCHRPISWTAVRWNHAAAAGVPLSPAHRDLGCDGCHKAGNFTATAVACVSCHRKDYDATTAPGHAAAGFPITCDVCHSVNESSWRSRAFAHASIFPLVGVHATLPCQSCHRNNVYRGTARDCSGCHLAQYNSTRNPNHAAAGFPTACGACHRATDTNWQQGRFTHSAFPLSGRHNVACAQCHTTGNFADFNCGVCHDRGSTDRKHGGISGYRYDSRACYSCHPTGRG